MDGTKIEANANRYTFVWGKAVSKHKLKLQEKVHALFANIEATEDQKNVSTTEETSLSSGSLQSGTARNSNKPRRSLKLSYWRNPKTSP